MNSLEWLLGLKVKVTTILDESIVGKVYAFDQVTNTVTLQENSDDYRVIKSTFIKEIAPVDKSKKPPTNSAATTTTTRQTFSDAQPGIGPVSVSAAKKREVDGVKAARKAIAARGVGVTTEGQFVFDVLSRTLPCKWYEKSIIVFDEVIVDPPYTSESCRIDGDSGSQAALNLVRKNVIGARDRMANELKGG